MTISQFLLAFRRVAATYEWRITDSSCIRSTDGCCPVTAMFNPMHPSIYANVLRLQHRLYDDDLIAAADDHECRAYPRRARLRRILLRMCKLEETQ